MGFFDWFNPVNILIVVLAGVNVYIYIRSLNSAKRLYGTLLPQEYAPKRYIPVSEKIGARQIMMEIQLISQRREKAFKWYVYFSNITTVFPLLGIFGTVISLIGTVNGSEDLSGNFFVALTSTALGIVAAVVFKVLDCPVAAKLDECERLSEQVISELNDMLRARANEEDESFRPEDNDMELYKERFAPKKKRGGLLSKLYQKPIDPSEEGTSPEKKPEAFNEKALAKVGEAFVEAEEARAEAEAFAEAETISEEAAAEDEAASEAEEKQPVMNGGGE